MHIPTSPTSRWGAPLTGKWTLAVAAALLLAPGARAQWIGRALVNRARKAPVIQPRPAAHPIALARVMQGVADSQVMRRARAVQKERQRAIDRYVEDGHGVYPETVGYMTVAPPHGHRATGLSQVTFQVGGGPSAVVRDRGNGVVTVGTPHGEYVAHRGPLQGLGHAQRLASEWVGTPHWQSATNTRGPAFVKGGSRIEFRTAPTPGRQVARGAALAAGGAAAYAGAEALVEAAAEPAGIQEAPDLDDLLP